MPQYLACNTFPAVYKVWKYPSSAAAANGGGICVYVCMHAHMPIHAHTHVHTHACVYVFEQDLM